MRGKVQTGIKYGKKVRITPACAGKSTSALKDFSGAEDHPRVCGEKRISKNYYRWI